MATLMVTPAPSPCPTIPVRRRSSCGWPRMAESMSRASSIFVNRDVASQAPSEAPQPGDQVLEEDGARVFLEETAAETLDDKILDAQVDDAGGVQFTIANQTV